jgi:predicted Fe-Mo cluster-binding NifX family protein
MRVVVSAEGADVAAAASGVFARCPTFLVVDTGTGKWQALPNPAREEAGGAGVRACDFVIRQGAEVVLTGRLGPHAAGALRRAGIPVFRVAGGSVAEAVDAWEAGRLDPLTPAR